jgi:acetolactate synthase I/II/III large subunit
MQQEVLTNTTSVADAYLSLLSDRGVDCIFANAGTDFAPIIEAFAKAQATGGKTPRAVTVPHENVAVAMAQGYYCVTGRPQVVMVHVSVGTANTVCGTLNAHRAGIPFILSAGRSPITEEGVKGTRDTHIHWPQEMFDQAGMVREAVKWDYELRMGETIETVVDRALNIAMSSPKGPVYLTLPREVLASTLPGFKPQFSGRRVAATDPAPDPAAIDEAADLIAKAENPVIISGAGQDPASWHALTALAENHVLPVVQFLTRFQSISSDHPMNLGYNPKALLEAADVVVVLDSMVPWLPTYHHCPPTAKVIQIAPDPHFSFIPIRGFPANIAITSTATAACRALDAALAERSAKSKTKLDARRKKLAEQRAKLVEGWNAEIQRGKTESPVSPAWIGQCLNQAKGEDAILVKEAGVPQQFLRFTKPQTFLSPVAAGGLGAGMGTALGAKLAAPDKLTIALEGDGSYMFCCPIAAHFVSAQEKAPVLWIVFNNGRWNAVQTATRQVNPTGYASKSNREVLTHLSTEMNYEKAVEVAGGYGEKVTDPAEFPKALDRAIKEVQVNKRQALLNVVSSGGL